MFLSSPLTLYLQPVGMFPGKYSIPAVKGDCSLSISNVDLRLDDGQWECQVYTCPHVLLNSLLFFQITSSSFSSQDALASRKARLTVQGNRTTLV